MMLDLMKTYGRSDGLLLLHTVNDGVKTYRNGRPDPVSRLGRST